MKYLLFFFICYYYHYYFVASWSWLLTYIYSNFEITYFGLSSFEFFFESLYATDIYLQFFSFFYFFSIFIFYFYFLLSLSLLFCCCFLPIFFIYVYVFSTSSSLAEKLIKIESWFLPFFWNFLFLYCWIVSSYKFEV